MGIFVFTCGFALGIVLGWGAAFFSGDIASNRNDPNRDDDNMGV